MVRVGSFRRGLKGLICAAALPIIAFSLWSSNAHAQTKEWQFTEFNDPTNKGRMTATLVFGVPGTNDVQIMGSCEARAGSGLDVSVLTMAVDTGELSDFTDIELNFSGRNFSYAVSGSVHGASASEEGRISGVIITPKHDDPLWEALIKKIELNYFIPGLEPSTLDLRNGTTKISNFLQACKSYDEALAAEKDAKENSSMPEMAKGLSEKEAFELAKTTATYEAWSAFAYNFPSGLYANVARGYLAQLQPAEPEVVAAVMVAPEDSRPVPPVVSDTATAKAVPEVVYPTETRTFKDYQVVCEENGDCSAGVVTKLQGGGAIEITKLSILKTRAPEAPWVFSLSGFENGTLAIKIGGNAWRLTPDKGISVSPGHIHFLPPDSDAILAAMRRGITMSIVQDSQGAAKRSARFSLRGLIAGMSFINKTQDHPNSGHVTGPPTTLSAGI